MSAFNKLSIWITLAVAPFICQASDNGLAEGQFLSGYQKYTEKQYGPCADLLFNSITNGVSNESRARLYLAACQTKLGLRDNAVNHFLKISESDLLNEDKVVYKKLENTLATTIERATALQIWATPFAGVLVYNIPSTTSSKSTRSSSTSNLLTGVFYGLGADITKRSWTISMKGQSISFPQSDGSSSNQLLGLFGVGKSLSDSFSLWAKGIYISADQANLNSEKIAGLGLNWTLAPSLLFSADYFYSSYPNLSFGPLVLSEITASFKWNFLQLEKNNAHLVVGSESIFANAPGDQDPTTGFALKSSYNRFFGEFTLATNQVEVKVGGWFGDEAFGVRNQGMLVYSALEQHNYGWHAGFKAYPGPTWGIQLLVSQEDVTLSTLEATVSSIYGGILFKL